MIQTVDEDKNKNLDMCHILPDSVKEQILNEILKINIKTRSSQLDSTDNQIQSLRFLNEKRNINFITYEFLSCVDKEYINVTKFPCFLKMIKYKNIVLDLNQNYLKRIVELYVDKDDLNSCVIAGGFFTKYIANDKMSKFFPELFSKLKEDSDIDVYLNRSDLTQFYNGLKLTLRNVFKIGILYGNKSNPYSFSSFKIETFEGVKINFIASKINEFYSCLEHINDFDLDFSKIFYYYKYDSIFIHVSFFEQFDKLEGFFISKERMNNDAEKKLSISKKFLFKEKFWENKLNSEDRLIILNYFSILRKFPNPKINFLRFCKYCFKGFYLRENFEKYAELISFFIYNGKINENYFPRDCTNLSADVNLIENLNLDNDSENSTSDSKVEK
jgi:hypothetical protein